VFVLGVVDTTLAPRGAQYGVEQSKAEKVRQLRYGATAILYTVQTDNPLKVRFRATLGEEPEVEVALA
jgi:hypothetical protein